MNPKTAASQKTAPARAARKANAVARKQANDIPQDPLPKERPQPTKRLPPPARLSTEATNQQEAITGVDTRYNSRGHNGDGRNSYGRDSTGYNGGGHDNDRGSGDHSDHSGKHNGEYSDGYDKDYGDGYSGEYDGEYGGGYDGGYDDGYDGGYNGGYDDGYDGRYDGGYNGGYNGEHDGGSDGGGGFNGGSNGGSNGPSPNGHYDNGFGSGHSGDHRAKFYRSGDDHSERGSKRTGSLDVAEPDEYGTELEQYGRSPKQQGMWHELYFHRLLTSEVEHVREPSIEVDDDGDLLVPFDIPVEGVNHTMTFRLDVSWNNFEWEIAQKLKALPSNIHLSYKLASQTKAEMPRALANEKDLEDLMRRCEPFVSGQKKCGRGKEFCVQLFPKVTVSRDVPTPTQTQKVHLFFSDEHSADRCNRGRQKERPIHLELGMTTRGALHKDWSALRESVPGSGWHPIVTLTIEVAQYWTVEHICASFRQTSQNG